MRTGFHRGGAIAAASSTTDPLRCTKIQAHPTRQSANTYHRRRSERRGYARESNGRCRGGYELSGKKRRHVPSSRLGLVLKGYCKQGSSSSGHEMSTVSSISTVAKIMRRHGVKRILAMSTASFLLPTEKVCSGSVTFLLGHSKLKLNLRHAVNLAMHQRPLTWSTQLLLSRVLSPRLTIDRRAIAATLAAQADLDWTVFRVPLLNDNEAELPVWAGLLTTKFRGTSYLSRGSLARWVLEEIEEGRWIGKAPALGNWGDVDDRRIIRSTLVG